MTFQGTIFGWSLFFTTKIRFCLREKSILWGIFKPEIYKIHKRIEPLFEIGYCLKKGISILQFREFFYQNHEIEMAITCKRVWIFYSVKSIVSIFVIKSTLFFDHNPLTASNLYFRGGAILILTHLESRVLKSKHMSCWHMFRVECWQVNLCNCFCSFRVIGCYE